MDFRKEWGRSLADARHRAGISQERLARNIDVAHQTVSRWERGVRTPRDRTRRIIADALGVPVAELFPQPTGDTEAA